MPWITDALAEIFPGAPVYRVDDATAARIEGFEPERGWIGEPGPAEVDHRRGACRFAVTPGGGHKTGFYLDQRDNRALVAAHARGRRVLDGFSYTGAFACDALAAGAASALLLDSSADALARARRNLELNGFADRAELRPDNAFDALRQLEARGSASASSSSIPRRSPGGRTPSTRRSAATRRSTSAASGCSSRVACSRRSPAPTT